jgi:hypothetical protein
MGARRSVNESVSWRITVKYNNYAKASEAAQTILRTGHNGYLFEALDKDGEPVVRPEDLVEADFGE